MNTLTIAQIAALAVSAPSTALVVEGPPGCGKTFGLAAELEKAGYTVLRIDAQNIQPEFLAELPLIDAAAGTVKFVSHDVWKPQPKLAIMIDELFKAPKHVVDAFLSLVFGNEFMGHKYSSDCIRIITCNNAEFSLGDKELPHMGNRTCRVQVAEMRIGDATKIMVDLGFDARILRWAEVDPAALISWDADWVSSKGDTEKVNYYGYDPKFPKRKFVSLRALEMASNYLKASLPAEVLRPALSGVIGDKAAVSLLASLSKTKHYVTAAQLRADPAGVKLPAASYDKREMVVGLALAYTKEDRAWIPEFFTRLSGEFAHLFCSYAAHKPWAVQDTEACPLWLQFLSASLKG